MEQFPYAWIIFVSFVLIATFVMVNLIIAIVVEAMNRISKDEESVIIDSIQKYESATKADLEKLEAKIDALHELIEQNQARK
jgi:voltage-gated sodium channel